MTKYMEKHPNWKGLVEEEPSEEQLRDVLASFDLFLYCGHGSGTKFLPSIEVQRMECRALALLFGCSSGKLVQYGKKVEPHGVAYSYLLAGSPGVLGALCVVTDVDTDLITQAFLDTWLSGNVDLLSSLVKARKVAKSPFNAAACIFYGLPSISLLS
ncbi:unnamed protein product [Darwinula stevensoni]|uniref:separase n=1 Tax=Darwinula stevensoni TaxID=69355 RepID=A0A7R9AD60_9CRUS|nr:unnamed protein product [Darwinula stevensoni]CAG0900805.1 unnamed protein product [Darwinula stevensoni]